MVQDQLVHLLVKEMRLKTNYSDCFGKNYANKSNSYMGLEDVLKLHWLYSSNKLQKLAEVRHQLNKCSHNRRSCKQK